MAPTTINIYCGENSSDSNPPVMGSVQDLLGRIINELAKMSGKQDQQGKDIQTLMALTTQEEADLQELANDVQAFKDELDALKTANDQTVTDLTAKLTQAGLDTAAAQKIADDFKQELADNQTELDAQLSGLKSSFSAILPAPVDPGTGTVNNGTTVGP